MASSRRYRRGSLCPEYFGILAKGRESYFSRPAGGTSATSWTHANTVVGAETLCGMGLYPDQELKILGNEEQFSLRQRIVKLGPVTVDEIMFGADVRLECGELHDSYHVNIPMTGHIESEHRGIRVTADSEYATAYQPEIYTALPYWSAETRLLCIKFDRSVVDAALRDALRNTVTTQIDFGAHHADPQRRRRRLGADGDDAERSAFPTGQHSA
jgi:hypothetical protein